MYKRPFWHFLPEHTINPNQIYNMTINKKGKSIRMAPDTDVLLKKLCEKLNDSESNVIKKAIEDLARKEKVQKSSP